MKVKLIIKLVKKSIFCSATLGLILFNLTGCASMEMRQEQYTRCINAPVLYTDLSKLADSRKYSLPSGEVCPGFGGE